MRNSWASKNSKFYPFIILLALFIAQHLHAQWSLQSYRDFANQNHETLVERMREDNVPSNIKQHIIYVQNQSAFNTGSLVSSLLRVQTLFQFVILVIFYNFCSTRNHKFKEEQSDQ